MNKYTPKRNENRWYQKGTSLGWRKMSNALTNAAAIQQEKASEWNGLSRSLYRSPRINRQPLASRINNRNRGPHGSRVRNDAISPSGRGEAFMKNMARGKTRAELINNKKADEHVNLSYYLKQGVVRSSPLRTNDFIIWKIPRETLIDPRGGGSEGGKWHMWAHKTVS